MMETGKHHFEENLESNNDPTKMFFLVRYYSFTIFYLYYITVFNYSIVFMPFNITNI